MPALLQTLITRFAADPVVFAQDAHPARVARGWVLARLGAQVAGLEQGDEGETSGDGGGSGGGSGRVDRDEDVERDVDEDAEVQEVEKQAARALFEPFGLAPPLMVYALVRDVAERVDASHGPESRFAKEVGREMGRLREEIQMMGGVEPGSEVFEGVWEVLRKVASLEQDGGWEWWRGWERERRAKGAKGAKGKGVLVRSGDREDDGIGVLVGEIS